MLGGSISGTVTEEGTGTPLEDVQVDVCDLAWGNCWGAQTDAAGDYTVGGLRTGDYKVQFSHSSYVAEWWDDKTNFGAANTVAVVQGADSPGINAALAVGGSISGTVTDEATGLPLQGVDVEACDLARSSCRWAQTDAAGDYTVGGLRTGDYKVQFGSGSVYVSEWWNDKAAFGATNTVAVVQGVDTPGIDAALVLGGSISGTVTEEGTGTRLEDVQVDVCDLAGDTCWGALTDAAGHYTVGGLRAGDTRFSSGRVRCMCRSGGMTRPRLVPRIWLGSSRGWIPPALTPPWCWVVRSRVRCTEEGTGTPLQDVLVMVYPPAGDWVGYAWTDAAGNYTVRGLAGGNYTVRFWQPPYAAEWWDDKSTFGAANTVAVVQGVDTPGIDAALLTGGGSISGTVTEEGTGNPLADVYLEVRDLAEHWMGWAVTDAAGTYSVGGLATGTYKVQFSHSSYATEWWDDKPTFGAANTVAVVVGADTPRIDAALGNDLVAPSLTLPANMLVEATGPSGAVVSFTSSASDTGGPPSPVVTCTPPSGSTFPLGMTTVSCSATDAAGNTGTGSFTVTVRDTTAPSLTLPANMTVMAIGPSGATVAFTASASDTVSPLSPPVICVPPSGSVFPLGMTTVSCSATDAAGNTGTGSFTVTVRDTTVPSLTLPANMTVEATGSSGAVVTFVATATDNVGVGVAGADLYPAVGFGVPVGDDDGVVFGDGCGGQHRYRQFHGDG